METVFSGDDNGTINKDDNTVLMLLMVMMVLVMFS